MRVAILAADGTFTGRTYSGPIVHVPLRPGESWTPLTQEHRVEDVEPVATVAEMWRMVRLERDRRMAASDWIVTRSLEEGHEVPRAWREYRQKLRDVTAQADPFSIIWPTAPE